ncbi:cupin domain-containing protein [Chloroflexota bacterium]
MEIFRIDEFIKTDNPNPGTRFKIEFLEDKEKIENLGGLFGLLPPGVQTPYHFHNKRESIIIPIRGEATEIVEGEEIPIKANDILYIPAGEKHATVNRTDKDFLYLEFHTYPPVGADFIEVE